MKGFSEIKFILTCRLRGAHFSYPIDWDCDLNWEAFTALLKSHERKHRELECFLSRTSKSVLKNLNAHIFAAWHENINHMLRTRSTNEGLVTYGGNGRFDPVSRPRGDFRKFKRVKLKMLVRALRDSILQSAERGNYFLAEKKLRQIMKPMIEDMDWRMVLKRKAGLFKLRRLDFETYDERCRSLLR